jgi:hypothetical protein
MCVVSNGQYLGGGFRVAPRTSTSDGLLDVVVLKESGTLKRVDELVKMKSGNYADDPNILCEQTKKIKITSREREVGVTVDGEPIGLLPPTFEIMPGALQFPLRETDSLSCPKRLWFERLSTLETAMKIVPEHNFWFAQFPTKIHSFIKPFRRKVD